MTSFAARTAASLLVAVSVGSGVAIAQTEADRAEALEQGLDANMATERFAVFWSTDEASSDQVRELVEVLDGYYEGISTLCSRRSHTETAAPGSGLRKRP